MKKLLIVAFASASVLIRLSGSGQKQQVFKSKPLSQADSIEFYRRETILNLDIILHNVKTEK